jgi:hypothetical protein
MLRKHEEILMFFSSLSGTGLTKCTMMDEVELISSIETKWLAK